MTKKQQEKLEKIYSLVRPMALLNRHAKLMQGKKLM